MLKKIDYKNKTVGDIPDTILSGISNLHKIVRDYVHENGSNPTIALVPPTSSLAFNGAEILGLRIIVTDQVDSITLGFTSA